MGVAILVAFLEEYIQIVQRIERI